MADTRIAIACQGGGTHCAFTAGALGTLLEAWDEGFYSLRKDKLHLVGLSGTSGGALTAFGAWYGLLFGGWKLAQDVVRDIWRNNSATEPRQRWINMNVVAGTRLAPGAVISPYLNLDELFRAMDHWWFPRDITSLRELIDRSLTLSNVAPLQNAGTADATSSRARLADKVGSRYHKGPYQAGVREAPPKRDQAARDELLPDLERFVQRLDGNPALQADIAKLLRDFKRNGAPASGLPALQAAVDRLVPRLLVGATDESTGKLALFDSLKGDITVEALLASAAVPTIARAVVGRDGDFYYDGLYSYNPPLSEFVTNPGPSGKPDEIWLIQINPRTGGAAPPRTAAQIVDRTNELIGNLPLEHEIARIELINEQLERSLADPDEFHPIRVMRFALDTPFLESDDGGAIMLDYASKIDRDTDFIEALRAHGRLQAQIFLLVREFTQVHWEPGHARSGSFARWGEQFFGGRSCRVAIREMTLHGGANGAPYRVEIDWRATGPLDRGRRIDGEYVEISGRATFEVGPETNGVRTLTAGGIPADQIIYVEKLPD
jgi:predicted acylesterase/phospholipase RssA